MRSIHRKVVPLSQAGRPPRSLPLHDADLSLNNANWTKGLQAMADWIWAGNLNPMAFPNNLARYFLQIPAIFEHQLHYSTTLIFDEPSFKNGVQISGFLNRVARELVISLIAQRRRCWYSMTHHALLGRLTSNKHGLSESQFTAKFANVLDHATHPEFYTRVERAMLAFADAFATNPKLYTKAQFEELTGALKEDNDRRYAAEGLWLKRMDDARMARARALLQGGLPLAAYEQPGGTVQKGSEAMSPDLNECKVNAQIVELAFLCLQFVALSCIFTGLNIPDEDALASVLMDVVPAPVIERINELNQKGPQGMAELLPPPVEPPLKEIVAGQVVVEPVPLRDPDNRLPMIPYDGRDERGNFRPAFALASDRDKGLTVGGIQVGVYGWGLGGHFPGSLAYCLMHHPELARFEAPYSLPLLFNEDEWRNGVQTGGYVSRRLKELLIQKIYKLNRTRYGIEHHTMYLYGTFFDEHGVGGQPRPQFSQADAQKARELALQRAHKATLYVHDHLSAPRGVYTPLEVAVMSWAECLLRNPHEAYKVEGRVREELREENMREISAGLRRLDASPGLGQGGAMERLEHHQIAEMAMLIGHMDGLARVLTILRLPAEDPVQVVKGKMDPDGGIRPDLDQNGRVIFTGYFNNRPGFLALLRAVGVSDAVLTLNELMVNPGLCDEIKARLARGEQRITIVAERALKTAEF